MVPPIAALLLLQAVPEHDLSADFELPAGLEVTRWAESPALFNPAAIDVDERGRVWVAEAVNYRAWDGRNPGLRHEGGDRIIVLEDTDGDGTSDASHVFVQDPELVAPLGVAVVAGKVYVSCSPNLFVYTDVDGDGTADERETLLTGFGGHDHDHGLHSVVCGPDGKLYFTAGNAGPHVVTDKSGWTLRSGSVYRGGGAQPADNKPGLVSDDGRVWTGGLVCRVNPDGTGLEVLAHNFRNNYEVALDSWGEMYVTDNDDDGNGGCRTTWVMRGGNYGFFSADGSRSWQADRRPDQDGWTAHWHLDDPGVMPGGTRNGAGGPTGCCVYEGELMKRWLDGAVVNADAGARVVYAHFPERKGAGVELRKTDLLRAKGEAQGARWFRPSDVCAGTDGALFVSDWWDPGVGGHAAGDAEAYGRILRIAPRRDESGGAPAAPAIDLSTTAGALAALGSPAVNVRELGRRALAAATPEALAELERSAAPGAEEPLLARLACALDSRADFTSTIVGPGEDVWRRVEFAVRRELDRWDRPRTAEALEKVFGTRRVLDDPAATRELLGGLRTVPFVADGGLLRDAAALIAGGDRTLIEAFGIASAGDEAAVFDALLPELGGEDPLAWSAGFEALAWRLHPPQAVPAFRARALSDALPADARKRALDALAFTPTRDAAEAMLAVALTGPDDLRAYAAWWVRDRDGNDWRAFGLGQRLKTSSFDDAERVFQSDVVREGVTGIDVDVTGAETLWLVVTDADDGNACDWADWIRPRLEVPGGTRSLTESAWLSADAGWGSVNFDRNCDGGPLRLSIPAGSPEIADGIGTHAPSRIAFALPDGATRFRAMAGPDARGVEQGCGTSMRFEVWITRPPAASRVAEWEAAVLDAAVALRDRIQASIAMAHDPQGALRLIQLRGRGELPAELVGAVAEAIHRNPDLGVRALASAAFPRPGAAEYPSIPELVAMLDEGPDVAVARGRELFQDRERAQCVACHAYKLGDTTLGGDVGPDLTAIGDKYDAAAVFDAILNPSAAIAHGYDTYLLETAGGGLYSGFLLADGPTIVLKDTRGERHVLDAADVVHRAKQELSTMPEGVALGLAPQELSDLVAFLRAPPVETGLLARDALPLGEPIELYGPANPTLDAWTFHLPEGARMEDTWRIAGGMLQCEGQPIGYIRTKEPFTSYHLAVEWRFDPAKGSGNSGVLLRVNGEDKVWPRSIEAQLHSRNAGDIWNIDAFGMQVATDRTFGRRTVRAQPCSEHELGEWNRYDVFLIGSRLELYVNGVLQNAADWCEETPGFVALQSEGAPIEFRSVVLTPLAGS